MGDFLFVYSTVCVPSHPPPLFLSKIEKIIFFRIFLVEVFSKLHDKYHSRLDYLSVQNKMHVHTVNILHKVKGFVHAYSIVQGN